jgi:predicted ATPase/DNA-binding SARP family transcriptional activator
VDVELLGPPGVRIGGERREVAGRQGALLALLALDARRPVSPDRLLEAIWGEALPDDPSNALQQRVSSLRRVVDPDRTGEVLVRSSGGYVLQVDDEHLDARRFLAQARRGHDLLADDPAAARRLLTDALSLWRGPALDGFAHEPWAIGEAGQLEESRLTVLEDRIDAALALGEGAELVGELTELVTGHPLRERACGQLMVALYRAGRQADALDLYDRTRKLLAEELGVDPGPDLQALYRRVLDQDGALQVSRTPRSPAGATDNLPVRTSSVIGRDHAVERVRQLLEAGRLVTLTGPGGAGKTTLAIEAARAQPRPADGTWLVELGAVPTGDGVVTAVARTLGVEPGGLGAPDVDVDGLVSAVAGRDLLLVLDNGEHLVEDVAHLTARLLARTPGLRVLATSREPLGVAGELVWSVPTLGVPRGPVEDASAALSSDAVQLLVARAGERDPDFVLEDRDAELAATLVRRLDGIPLAIELAAARLRTLSLAEIVAGLADRFSLLASTVRGVPSRQRTLRGALDWSWDLLDASLQDAWAALAIPSSWFEPRTAARLLDAAGVVRPSVDVVADLVDRSLLLVDRSEGSVRYRMLETIREYGRDRLDGTTFSEQVRARHADLVEEALAACSRAGDPARWEVDLDGLATWLDEARVAMAWAEASGERQRLQRLAGGLGWLWLLRGLAGEGRDWLRRGLGPVGQVEAIQAEPEALLWASGLRVGGADPEAPSWAQLSLATVTTDVDRVVALTFAGVHHAHAGQLDASAERLEEAARLAAPIGGWPLGLVQLIGAQLARLSGRTELVRERAAAALDLLTSADVGWARVLAIDIVIDGLQAVGDHARARDLAEEGLSLCRRERLIELEGRMHLQLGLALHELGEVTAARPHLDDAIDLARAAGVGAGLGYTLGTAGSVARRDGDLDLAEERLQAALVELQGAQTLYGRVLATEELARVAALRGDPDQARERSRRCLALAHESGVPELLARGLEVLAVATAQTDRQAAIRSLATAATLRERGGAPPSPGEAREVDRLIAELQAAGGPAAFDDAWSEAAGRASLDPGSVVDELLGATAGPTGG